MAGVIPASFHSDRQGLAPRVTTTPKVVHAHLPAKAAEESRFAAPQTIAARMNLSDAAMREGLMAIRAVAAQENVPEFRTLVYIETSQYRTADATVWSVEVWQVTVRSVVAARLARTPVANKT
jgi:hypothetical protein